MKTGFETIQETDDESLIQLSKKPYVRNSGSNLDLVKKRVAKPVDNI